MAYRKFAISPADFKASGDNGDNGDKMPESVENVATVADVAQPLKLERRILSHAEVMALPIMPCTTCGKFKWGRRPSCAKYQSLADPKKGCRCIHYEGQL